MTKENPYNVDRVLASVEKSVRLSAAVAAEEAFFEAVRDALTETFEIARAQAQRLAREGGRSEQAVAFVEATLPMVVRGVFHEGADRGYAIASPATHPERLIRFPFRLVRGKDGDAIRFDTKSAGEVTAEFTPDPSPVKAVASKGKSKFEPGKESLQRGDPEGEEVMKARRKRTNGETPTLREAAVECDGGTRRLLAATNLPYSTLVASS